MNPCGDQFWDLFLMDFHLKIVGLRKAAKAIIHYKNTGFSVYIVFKMDIASSPLGGFVWSPEWLPFGAPKTEEKIPKADQERFWAVLRGQRRPSKRDPKMDPKKVSKKSGGCWYKGRRGVSAPLVLVPGEEVGGGVNPSLEDWMEGYWQDSPLNHLSPRGLVGFTDLCRHV